MDLGNPTTTAEVKVYADEAKWKKVTGSAIDTTPSMVKLFSYRLHPREDGANVPLTADTDVWEQNYSTSREVTTQ
ncbi:MAG: hypothetical protein Q9173_005713 [Seirophora scorigena]